jgi:hypothetical protein
MDEVYKHLKTAELSNWTGKAFIGQRKHINIIQDMEELSVPGIYFLLADIEGSYQKKLYIGEADEINNRLKNHFVKKDWWESFVCFISKDSNLTKAHVRYLEKLIYQIALNNKTILVLDNNNVPTGSKLPISDCDDMDEFSEQVIFVLKNLGILDFTNIESNKDEMNIETNEHQIKFYMNVPGGKGVESRKAELIIKDGLYILIKGSYIRNEIAGKATSHNYAGIRKQLEKEGYFESTESKDFGRLNKNVEFNSPSAAAAVVRNSSINGRKEWKNEDGMTLDGFENMD